MDYSPNVDALRWFFGEIHDRLLQQVPDLRVWIVGKAPVDEVKAHGTRKGVTVTGPFTSVWDGDGWERGWPRNTRGGLVRGPRPVEQRSAGVTVRRRKPCDA